MDSREAEYYKEMYLKMARAAEKAIDILIEVQREYEDMYIEAGGGRGGTGAGRRDMTVYDY